MNNIKEIGGYIELDKYCLPMIHDKAIALNYGRSCLLYLIRARKIKKILLPKFLCGAVGNVCKRENLRVRYYSIDESFYPENITLQKDEWIYLVNYYGQLENQEIKKLYEKYRRIIVDQTQAYFQQPIKNIDTFYSCRKFLGVPDGAFLYTNAVLNEELPQDESYHKMNFLLGRYERTATEFYHEYIVNEKISEKEPMKRMSRLTMNLLHGIDYKRIQNIRTENYIYLYRKFKMINKLNLRKINGAFMYPLYIENGEIIRKKLQKLRIYIPILWPDVPKDNIKSDLAYKMSVNILPLPCDQRYGEKEMFYIVDCIMSNL